MRSLRRFVGATALAIGACMALPAQHRGAGGAMTTTGGGGAPPTVPSMVAMAQAVRSQDYTTVQLRRFREPQGGIVTVRERLEVDANGTLHPDFALTFLAVEGELPGSPRTLEWQSVYTRFAPLFFSHGTFRVRNATAAAANYTLHDFGQAMRAGRVVQRVIVFPQSFDKTIWVVDVDQLTSVPLYFAEFDLQLQVLAEVEVQTFTASVGPLPVGATSIGVTQLPNFAAARAFMGNPAQMVNPVVALASEYHVDSVQVHADPLNGRQKLLMTYTDGVDQFVVVQAPGTPDVFAGLPGKVNGGNVIARFRDPAMSVLLFWEGGVSFHVAGRGSLTRLDALARDVYVQAIQTQ